LAREHCDRGQAAQRTDEAEAHELLLESTDGMPILGTFLPRFQAERRWRPVDRLDAYAAILAITACGMLISLWMSHQPLSVAGAAWPLILFAFVAAIAERESIPVTPNAEISVAFLPLVFVEVVFGPLAAALVGAATMLLEFPPLRNLAGREETGERPYLRWLVWTSNRVIIAIGGGLVAQAVLGRGSAFAIVLATTAAIVTNFALDALLVYLTVRARGNQRARDVLSALAKVAAAGIPIYGAVAALLAYAYLEITPLSAALFFIPALAAHRFFVVSRKQQEALASLASANDRLEKANLSFATALVATLDARDRYTAGHSEAVAMYARDIASEFGWSPGDQQLVDLCGLVHDIGKIGLPAGLLEKPGALTPDERVQMEEHSAIGERILANVEDYAEIAIIVRHHHERWDGGGYPDGLAGTAIPMISRVLAVADAYDAMTSDRPYRAALPSGEALRRLKEGAGSQFDSDVVAAFDAVLSRAHPQYLAGRGVSRSRDAQQGAVALAS
jgi:putative nucleotidyltransferase with HDIG domain